MEELRTEIFLVSLQHLHKSHAVPQGRRIMRVSIVINFFICPDVICAECVNCEASYFATLISHSCLDVVDPHINVFIAFHELNIIARIQYYNAFYYEDCVVESAVFNQANNFLKFYEDYFSVP